MIPELKDQTSVSKEAKKKKISIHPLITTGMWEQRKKIEPLQNTYEQR